MTTPMHVSMPNLPSAAFMGSMESIEPAVQLLSPPSYIPDFPVQINPFTIVPATVNLEMSSPSTNSLPSIHGTASSYSVGVTSSLESALDPAGVTSGRSRANTSASPSAVPPSFMAISPTSQQAMDVTFPPPEVELTAPAHVETTTTSRAHIILGEMLQDIAKTASSAGDACIKRHGAEASSKVDELKERISMVSDMISGMMSVSLSEPSSSPPPFPQPGADILEYPSTYSYIRAGPLGFPPTGVASNASTMVTSDHSDHPRKRCASALEEQRTVKALKREPQDENILSLPPTTETLAVGDAPPIFTAGVPVPVTIAHPITLLPQSRPPSRPPTPLTSFSSHGPFGTIKQQASAVLNYPAFIPASLDFSTNLPPSASPTFPALQSSWSDSIVPSRHHHSLSAGSINGSLLNTPLSFPVPPSNGDHFPPPQPISVAPAATISPPIGRMSRSGSVNGAFNNPFAFGYPQTFPETPTSTWPPELGRVSGPVPAPTAASPSWFTNNADRPLLSGSPSATSEVPSTTRNSPTDDEEDEETGGDSDENDGSPSKNHHQLPTVDGPSGSGSGSDVPHEYRAEVDRIFFEYLNKICSNLDAKDSKGEPIHQTLMAKKMQRLDESPDFRPFKFRIQAFTLAFLEELARQGYPEEKIPMKKIRNYLWRQRYILRFNEDGKKAKSKGNHIWNIEAKKSGDGKWEFRPFYRRLAGTPPSVAYCGLKWSWTPRVWDPQASWQNIPVQYSSPSLPSWLSWKDDVLSGVPPPDAESCQITANAQFVLDGQEGHLTHTFPLTIAPMSTIDTATFSQSRRPSFAGDPPRRSTSDSVLFQAPRALPTLGLSDSQDTRVIRVLQSVAQRVTEETESQLVSTSPPRQGELQDLVKQKHVLEQTVNAYDKEISGQTHSQTRRLAVAAQNVVVQAAHTVIADRTAANGGVPAPQLETTAIQNVTVTELSDATQDAIAMAVKRNGTASTEVDIIVAATSILKARTSSTPPAGLEPTPGANIQPRSQSAPSTRLISNLPTGFPTNLPSLSEYV
ncbi:hypothetical protein BD779DRAFT_1436998 [Infundibulicybe gibba]|nr:hypothetical protein BD779DRAFT_1436998 [Infundibulicybe gibba]